MNKRERFLAAATCQPVDRPPVWIMRQAGRHLPEYREFKLEHSFHEIVQNPEYACEVTMQPLRRYQKLDAAIVFSDILVIPEALGQPYHFRPTGGIEMEFALDTDDDVERLSATGVPDKLRYVAGALKTIRASLEAEFDEPHALIGFGGSPWTLATYMIEGQSSKDYSKSREWFYAERERFDALLEKVTDALIQYFHMQIEAGADAIQIFDSWGGVLPPHAFVEGSTRWMKRIVDEISGEVPVIVFSKGMHEHTEALVDTGANVLGVTWTAKLHEVRDRLPANVGVQGNLDPVVLHTTPEVTEREVRRVLDGMGERTGFIFNLGHGIAPTAKPENMQRLVDVVASYGEGGA
ncbi:MAG: uroporphyrinogen decarboxylase [Myxococcota bacterium]